MAGPAALPATLIAGFGGAGREQAIATLLRHQPQDQQWAVIATAGAGQFSFAGAWTEHVAPGCPCCTGLVPFSTGLTRLLRRLQGSAVSRLLIEGGPEGHIASVARLLAGEQFRQHVTLAGSVAVINPLWVANPAATAREALHRLADEAGALIASAWDEADAATRSAFADFAASYAPPKPWMPMDAVTPAFVFAAPRGNDGS
jgi:G3E family GTPase